MWICPFCGVATDTPHESQKGCLTALAEEITRMRSVLEHVQSAKVPSPPQDDDDPEDPATGD